MFSAVLLLITFSGQTFSAGRKKIRIHIPQKVKHIHHHKKIYITQHQATPTPFTPQYVSTEQYAPAYLGGEAAAGLGGLPALALLPLGEERSAAPGPPNLLPLYRARGHYGPTPVYRSSKRLAKARPAASEKRIKIITVSEPRKKRIIKKKKKTKHIVIRDEVPTRDIKNSRPNHSFHEEFYSDVKPNHNTYKTLQKPKRVEKYVDGNTEHIHTYSEEHIHQIVYDNPPEGGKPEGLEAAAVPQGAASFYSEHGPPPPAHALLPLDVALHHAMHAAPFPSTLSSAVPSGHSMISSGIHPSLPTMIHPVISGNHKPSYATIQTSMSNPIPIHAGLRPTFSLPSTDSTKHHGNDGSGTIGSLGTPAHMEYMDYNPHEASHDHEYHEHGEMHNHGSNKPSSPPKKLYSSDLPKINPTYNPKNVRPYSGKGSWVPQEGGGKLHEDFSHFDGSTAGFENNKKANHHTNRQKHNDEVMSSGFDEQGSDRPHTSSSHFNNENKKKPKRKPVSRSVFNHNIPKKPRPTNPNHKVHHSLESKPHSTPISYTEGDSYGSHKEDYREDKESTSHTFTNYKDSYGSGSSDPFETDTFVSSPSDRYKEKEINSGPSSWRNRKNKSKKKSVSTQNISFGGHDHKTVIDHFAEGSNILPTIDTSLSDVARQALAAEVSYSSLEGYYNVMASKAFDGSSPLPEASNTNIQIVEAPKLLEPQLLNTAQPQIELTTPKPAPSTSVPTNTLTTTFRAPRKHKKNSSEKKMPETSNTKLVHKKETKPSKPQTSFTNDRGKYKYGDRLRERYDTEEDPLIFV